MTLLLTIQTKCTWPDSCRDMGTETDGRIEGTVRSIVRSVRQLGVFSTRFVNKIAVAIYKLPSRLQMGVAHSPSPSPLPRVNDLKRRTNEDIDLQYGSHIILVPAVFESNSGTS
ncbi:hypothetical protein Tcan_01119, partial [Toxocara canis]